MVVKHIQIYGVHINQKCICKSKKLKVDLFTTPDKSFFGSYHHPLGRDKLHIPRISGGGLRTYFKMHCFKSTLTLLLFLNFLDLHCISLIILVTADFKSFPEFKTISYYSLKIKL